MFQSAVPLWCGRILFNQWAGTKNLQLWFLGAIFQHLQSHSVFPASLDITGSNQTWPQFVSERSGLSLDRYSDVRSKVRVLAPVGSVSERKEIWRQPQKQQQQQQHTHTNKHKNNTTHRSWAIYFSSWWFSGQGEKTREKVMDGEREGWEDGGVGVEEEKGGMEGFEGKVEAVERNGAELLSDTVSLSKTDGEIFKFYHWFYL